MITVLGVGMESVTFSGNLYGNLYVNSMVTGNGKDPSPVGDDHNTWLIKNTFGTAMFCSFSLYFAMMRCSNLFQHLNLKELSKSLDCNKNFGHEDVTDIRR